MRSAIGLTWTEKLLALAVCLAATAARAEGAEDPAPCATATQRPTTGDRFEIAMGFMGGLTAHGTTPFAFDGGSAAELPGATQLVSPFEAAPFTGVWSFGPRLESRTVKRHVRITTGIQWPFPRWRMAEATGTYDVGGVERLLTVRRLRSRDLRLGIGAEVPMGPVTPFADLVGSLHWITAELAIDGRDARYDATTFSYAIQAGLRLDLGGGFFIMATGEYGLVGEERFGAGLAVGGAFGT